MLQGAESSFVSRPRLGQFRATRRIESWSIPAALAIAGLALVSYGFGDSRHKLVVSAIAACASCLLGYVVASRLTPRYSAPRLIAVSYAVQLLALAAIGALGLPLGPGHHPFEISAADAPIQSVLAMAVVPLGAVLAAGCWSAISTLSPRSKRPDPIEDVADIAARRRPYLIIAAVAHLLYWPAGLENSGVLGYLGRVLATALVCAPFLAGRDSVKDRRLGGLWVVTLLVNALIGIAAGTRGKALVAAVLFAAGFISAVPKRKRIIVSICAVVATVPLIQLAGAMGVVRDQLGRGGLEMVEAGHLSEVFRQLSRELLPGESQDVELLREHGVSRLLAWTNVVVPMMTPQPVPYRGMSGLLDEAAETFQIASVSGSTPDDLYDAGLWNAPARQYGFSVNTYTSVEFTLAADGWSRGGALVALLFGFAAALMMIFIEYCVWGLHRAGNGIATILALPISKAAFFDTNFVPLLPTLRGMVLYTLVVAAVVVVVESVRRSSRRPRRQIAPMRGTINWRRG
jgi:hypothetical protein